MLNPESASNSAVDIQEHLTRCTRKKVSIAEYSRTHNIPAHRLYAARKKKSLAKKSSPKVVVDVQSIPEFVEVPLSISGQGISISLPGGLEIHLQQPLTPVDLAELIKALRP